MKNVAITIAVVLLLVGCSGVDVRYSAPAPELLAGLQTYAWMESTPESSDLRVKNPVVQKYVKAAVEKELARKGYVQAGDAEPDFLVAWFGKVDEKVKKQSVSHFYRSYGYGGAIASTMPGKVKGEGLETGYREGTLLIDIVAPESKKMLWRGSGTNTIVEGMNEQELATYLNNSVRSIFADFPSR